MQAATVLLRSVTQRLNLAGYHQANRFFVELYMRCSWIGRVSGRLGGALFAIAIASAGLVAQAAPRATPRPTPQQAMAAEARVSKDQARMTGMSKVPGGRMSSIELRRGASGKLIYIAMIQAPGQPRMTEVMIDAMTGVVMSTR